MTRYYHVDEYDTRVEAVVIPDGQFHTVRYAVTIKSLGGNEGQDITATGLFHDPAYVLLKMAGVPWRAANTMLDLAYRDALTADRLNNEVQR